MTVALQYLVSSAVDGPFGSSLTSAHYADEGARVIRLGNIGDGFWRDEDAAFVPVEYAKQLARHEARPGDVVVAGLGDANHPLGRGALVPDIGAAIVKADCFRLRLRSERLDARFFVYFMSARGTELARERAHGSTRQRLPLGEVLRIPVPVPPLDEQRRIADYLDTQTARIDTLIARNDHAASLVGERRTAVVTHGVEGAGPLRPFRYCLRSFIGGVWGGDPGEHEADVQVIRAADFDRMHHELTVARPPTRSITRAQLDSRRMRPGDLVLEKSGGGDTQPVGCVGIFRGADEPCVPSNFNALLRPRNDVHADYLNVACAAMYRSGESRQYINQTTGIQNIDVEAMLGHLVPVPPMRAQRAIAAKVSEEWANLDRVQDALDRQIELLRERRQALIAAAVTGELEL